MPATALSASDRAPGLLIGAGVDLPDDAWLGGGVIVHAGVTLGPGCVVQDHAVLGMRIGREQRDDRPSLPTRVGAAVTICASALVHESATIADHVLIGDQAHVARGAQIGAHSVVGRLVAVSQNARIGERVRIQHAVNIAPPGIVEDDVFIGPGVVTTNDNTVDRMGPDDEMIGPVLRRGCRIGAAVVFLPGIEVGEEAFVAAGSLLTRDVPARTIVMGRPARHVRAVEDADLLAARK